MATGVGTLFKTLLSSGGANLASSTFKCELYSTGWVDVDSTERTDQDYILNGADSSNSLDNFRLSTAGDGYDRVTLGTRTFAEVDARNAVEVDSTDITFSSVSSSAETGNGVAGGMAIFAELAASDSSGRVLATFYDFSTAITLNGGDVVVQFSTGGFLEFLASTSDAS